MATETTPTGSGCRLHRLEVFNWGTFDKRVWTFEVDGRNALLTGDIGSGKSTLVDAITTLLLPAHRISYNKAAGADTRERDLRSYVLGHYKAERNEETGGTRAVGLRDHRHYSVLLGVFANADFEDCVTLVQVFRAREEGGQPERFYVMADDDLSIANTLANQASPSPPCAASCATTAWRSSTAFPTTGRPSAGDSGSTPNKHWISSIRQCR